MFGGKGGVGKTTCAAAEGVRLAEKGARVLVVSTDPAHSLGDALTVPLGARPRRIPTRRGALFAAELDADAALRRWLGSKEDAFRAIAARGTYLDDADIDGLMRLSLPGVDELVGLVELARLARAQPYDEVVVDTAPTGHTLRLLEIPETLRRLAEVLSDMHAKHRFLAESLGGRYRPDGADDVIDEIAEQARSLRADLGDPERTTFAWVLVPEEMAVAESREGLRALATLGVAVREIRVNRLTPLPSATCDGCSARAQGERAKIAEIVREFAGARVRVMAAADKEPRGVSALRALSARVVEADGTTHRGRQAPPRIRKSARRSTAWLDEIAPRARRLVIVGGKGGVGKTTVAATVALAAASQKRKVLLLSADPAHSLRDALATEIGDEGRTIPGGPPSLHARELDASRAFAERRNRYRAGIDELFARILPGSFDATFDHAVALDLMDLAPPGLDELLAVLTLAGALFGPKPEYDLVVLDTAPTGHTLRLLAMPEAALAWVHAVLAILLKYRQVIGLGEFARDLVDVARELKAFQALLRDPKRTMFLPVTRAAAVVRVETQRLARELRRRRIPVGPILVNDLSTAETRLCKMCMLRSRTEKSEIRALARTSRAMLHLPATYPPPRGHKDLLAWGTRWSFT